MGASESCCCGKHDPKAPEIESVPDVMVHMDEFYDPFSEMKKKINHNPEVLKKHAPANAKPIDKIPY